MKEERYIPNFCIKEYKSKNPRNTKYRAIYDKVGGERISDEDYEGCKWKMNLMFSIN